MRCSHCGSTDRLVVYCRKVRNSKTYTYYYCNKCNTERHKKYGSTEAGKAAIRRAVNKYDSSHPERESAWNKVQRAIDTKKTIAKKPCEICGSTKGIHRHHPNILEPYEVQ